MSAMARTLLKLVGAIPLCLGALLGPFFLVDWIQLSYGVRIPSWITLAVALGMTYGLFFRIFKDEFSRAAKEQRERS